MAATGENPIVSAVSRALPRGSRALAALSGGADSVALLAALVDAGIEVTAVHCNYHLRGEESDRDERHARDVAARLGVSLTVVDCDVSAYRASHPGTSVEMACRELRYDAFSRIAAERDADYIAIGHHREDNRETMLLNLFRGTGLKGAGGMSVVRGNIVRPLLRCSREEITDYLRSKGLDYVVDSSNLTCDYRRNAIRNAILPAVRQYFPAVDTGLDASLEALAAQRRLLTSVVSRLRRDYVDATGAIDLSDLLSREESAREILFELLNYPDYRGYTLRTVDTIISAADKSGLRFHATADEGYRLERGRMIPIVAAVAGEPVTFGGFLSADCPDCFSAELIVRADFHPQRGDDATAYFDYDRLTEACPLTLRTPATGDRMRPFGMKGSRLLSDIFSDAKLPHDLRATHPVVADSRGCIIWLPGLRATALYPVTPTTRRIVKVTYRNS